MAMFLQMTRHGMWVLAVTVMIAAQTSVFAQDADGPVDAMPPTGVSDAPQGADAFLMIAERNVFNSRRTRRVERVERPVVEQRREPQVDSFALTGIIQYARGSFAFFDGSSSGFRKTVKPGDEIGGFSVASITPEEITLEREGTATRLAVGEQLRREEGGEWQLSKRTESYGSHGGGSSLSSRSDKGGRSEDGDGRDADSGGAGNGDAGGASDILKRLMEQRRKEMNQ